MHQQCRQSSLDLEFIIVQGRTLRLNCGTGVMQQCLHPVLNPLDRSKELQDQLELHFQEHRHTEKEGSEPCSDRHAPYMPIAMMPHIDTGEALWYTCSLCLQVTGEKKSKSCTDAAESTDRRGTDWHRNTSRSVW